LNLSQAKIDLAVLYKLHQHAEAGGDAIPPNEILRLFGVHIPIRRLELALEELYAKGDVEREYHPFYSDEGLWQVSRDGLARVDRAIRVPASFIGRLHQNGDNWLETEEAEKSVLQKLAAPEAAAPVPIVKLDKVIDLPSSRSIDWTKWGTILGALSIVVTVLLWWLS
jgi:hypothetical protein